MQEMLRRAFFWTQRCSYDNGNPCSLISFESRVVIIIMEYSGCACLNCGAECRLSAGRKDRFYSHKNRKQKNEKINSYIIVCGYSRVLFCMSDVRSTESGKHAGQRPETRSFGFTFSASRIANHGSEGRCTVRQVR